MSNIFTSVIFRAALLCFCLWSFEAYSADKNNDAGAMVVVSTKAIHSMASMIMGESGTPQLLFSGNTSPHDLQFMPRQLQMLSNADIVFYLHRHYESALKKPLGILKNSDTKVVELASTNQLVLLPFQRNCFRFLHEGCKSSRDAYPQRPLRYDNKERRIDTHLLYDMENALRITHEITRQLIALYPENEKLYIKNNERAKKRFVALDKKLKADLRPYINKPLIVSHDAYQYFTRRYGLKPLGAVDSDVSEQLSADHILKLRVRTRQYYTYCLIGAPATMARWERSATAGIDYLKTVTVDHLGLKLSAGPDFYFELMEQIGAGFQKCLSIDSGEKDK